MPDVVLTGNLFDFSTGAQSLDGLKTFTLKLLNRSANFTDCDL
jgi:hypothetical protein